MSTVDLWQEALGDALEAVGKYDALTSSEMTEAASILLRWAESINESSSYSRPSSQDFANKLQDDFDKFVNHEHNMQVISTSICMASGRVTETLACTYKRCNHTITKLY